VEDVDYLEVEMMQTIQYFLIAPSFFSL